jgi:hypothetical protein
MGKIKFELRADEPASMGLPDLFGRVEGKDLELERQRVDFLIRKLEV